MKETFRVEVEGETYGASRTIGPRRGVVDEPQHFRPLRRSRFAIKNDRLHAFPPRAHRRRATKNSPCSILVDAHTLCQLCFWSEL